MTVAAHPEAYERFMIGDEVWCLAWLGMPFVVVGKDDATQTLHIDGTGPCSLPEGPMLDIGPKQRFMLSHEQWDQIWYWPDSAGERYLEVANRFVASHADGDIVTGYASGWVTVLDEPANAMSFRLNLATYDPFGQIMAEPVAAVADDGTLVLAHDPSIPDERWVRSGPVLPLEITMVGWRWALAYGKVVLNWTDFV